MRIDGTLTKWNDDRGFGFITPKPGGKEVFVHISAFPKDGQRPRLTERVSFEIETDKSGKVRAINVSCPGRSNTAYIRQRNPSQPRRNLSFVGRCITLAILITIGFGYVENWGGINDQATSALRQLFQHDNLISSKGQTVTFRCDGRTYCSQMTSCDEAKFFLKNCPNVKMDGDNDGIPCEQQWCTGFFGN
jgi:cold shock CspA family protein